MAQAQNAMADDIWIGDGTEGGRSVWLSPALIGLSAPIVVGMVLAPQLLQGATEVIGVLLGALLLLAIGAYVLSVVAPGEPTGLIVRAGTKEVAILRRGLLARSEVVVPFSEVTKLSRSVGSDQDGYEISAVEVRTRDGVQWVIPGDVEDADLAQMRRMIGISSKAR